MEHLNSTAENPLRTVVLGASGFVGKSLSSRLGAAGAPVLPLSSKEIDLCKASAGEELRLRLRDGDALVFVSAIAPCKTPASLIQNLAMARAVCVAAAEVELAQVVYISSDAVYRDGVNPVSESSRADSDSLHGVMHRAREVMLSTTVRAPLAVLRPSLLYGAADPHNGYGPNRFRRQAARGEKIVLFGEGEEQRDHVLVDDVAEVIYRVLARRSLGTLNIATGRSPSFREVAQIVAALDPSSGPIEATPRKLPIVHRHFDITEMLKTFPDFRYTSIEDGLVKSRADSSDR